MTAAIEWGALLELIWVAPLAGLALSLSFSLVILGVSRANETRGGEAVMWGALAAAGGAAVVAGVAFALRVIIG